MEDASFEDATVERPIHISAETAEDLVVVSALIQDAIAQTSDMSWLRKKHRFGLVLNRFRWEDAEKAQRTNRPFERVQSMLMVESVLSVKAQGVKPKEKDIALNLLSISFDRGDDGAGTVTLTFAGYGAIALDVECLDLTLRDMSRPYEARSQRLPEHPEGS